MKPPSAPRTPRIEENEFDDLSHVVIGAALEVHKILGPGYLESVYEEALVLEMIDRKISFERQKTIGITYKGKQIGEGRLDFVISNRLVLELKAVELLTAVHTAQVISYLKMTGYQTGLLINFNVRHLKEGIKRISL